MSDKSKRCVLFMTFRPSQRTLFMARRNWVPLALRLLRSLNLRQREFFNHIIHWIKCRDEPIHAFLSGGAGVGKSVVIRALYQSLYRMLNLSEGENPDDIRVLLCAYMGTAAFNIGGNTICSAFHK